MKIIFIHTYQEQEFKNKTVIHRFDPNCLLNYTYETTL